MRVIEARVMYVLVVHSGEKERPPRPDLLGGKEGPPRPEARMGRRELGRRRYRYTILEKKKVK